MLGSCKGGSLVVVVLPGFLGPAQRRVRLVLLALGLSLVLLVAALQRKHDNDNRNAPFNDFVNFHCE